MNNKIQKLVIKILVLFLLGSSTVFAATPADNLSDLKAQMQPLIEDLSATVHEGAMQSCVENYL